MIDKGVFDRDGLVIVGADHLHDVDGIDAATRLDEHLRLLPTLPDTPGRNTVVVVGAGSLALRLRRR